MARGVLTAINVTGSGPDISPATTGDAANGHQVSNQDGRVYIHAKNTNSGSTARTITFTTTGTVAGLAIADVTHSLAAGALGFFGPFDRQAFGKTLLIDVSNAELHLSAVHV